MKRRLWFLLPFAAQAGAQEMPPNKSPLDLIEGVVMGLENVQKGETLIVSTPPLHKVSCRK